MQHAGSLTMWANTVFALKLEQLSDATQAKFERLRIRQSGTLAALARNEKFDLASLEVEPEDVPKILAMIPGAELESQIAKAEYATMPREQVAVLAMKETKQLPAPVSEASSSSAQVAVDVSSCTRSSKRLAQVDRKSLEPRMPPKKYLRRSWLGHTQARELAEREERDR